MKSFFASLRRLHVLAYFSLLAVCSLTAFAAPEGAYNCYYGDSGHDGVYVRYKVKLKGAFPPVSGQLKTRVMVQSSGKLTWTDDIIFSVNYGTLYNYNGSSDSNWDWVQTSGSGGGTLYLGSEPEYHTFVCNGVLTDSNGKVVGTASGGGKILYKYIPGRQGVGPDGNYEIIITANYGDTDFECARALSLLQANLGSVDLSFNLGITDYGHFQNLLKIVAPTAHTNLAQPSALLAITGSDYLVISSNNVLRQLLGPQALIDIVTNSAFKYDIRFYTRSNVGGTNGSGLYTNTGSAFKTITIENPDGATASNRLFVTEVESSVTNQTTYVQTSVNATNTIWTLTKFNGLAKETLDIKWITNIVYTELRTILQPTNDTIVYQELNTYTNMNRGGAVLLEQIVDPYGAALKTTFTYYNYATPTGTQLQRQGQLKDKTWPNGYWERYDYGDSGRMTTNAAGFLNNSISATDDQVLLAYTTYATNNPRETIIKKLQGIEISRKYVEYYTNEIREIVCQTKGASSSASDNLVAITTYYPSTDAFANRKRSIRYPDGTMTFVSYATNSGQLTTTITNGAPNSQTNVTEGTKTLIYTGIAGQMNSNAVFNLTNATLGALISQELYTYDATDELYRSPKVTYLDGTFRKEYFGCCTLDSVSDKDGTYTYYTYDGQKRLVTVTQNSVTASNVLNALGNTLRTIRFGSDGSQIAQFSRSYDIAGRLLVETNALNGVTICTNVVNSSGTSYRTNTYPNGGTRIEFYNQDRSLQKVLGTAAFPVRYDYGVTNDNGVTNRFATEIRLTDAGADTAEKTMTLFDMVGRPYKKVYAVAPGGSTPYEQSFFNQKGQLWKRFDPDGVTTLYTNNAKGELEFVAIDMDRNDKIDLGLTDRIAQQTNDVVANYSTDILRTRIFVWPTTNSSGYITNGAFEISTDGLRTWSSAYGLTNKTQLVYQTNGSGPTGYRFLTNTSPDSSYLVSTFYQGRLVTNSFYNAGNTKLYALSFAYDPHGRLKTTADSRNGTTTYTYNDADEVTSVTTPAPGTGANPQVTSVQYDTMWRPVTNVLADGSTVVKEYYTNGLLKKSFGSRTYPVQYTYDSQGRLTNMTTWQTFATLSGAANTTWSYETNRGWLISKRDAAGQGVDYTYTSGGRVSTRSAGRYLTFYDYDYSGALNSVLYAGSTESSSFVFDRRGQPVSTAKNGVTTTRSLNDAGLLLVESYSGGPLNGLGITNSYDSLLRLTNVLTLRATNSFAYDGASRLTNASYGTYSATYAYLANSPLVDSVTFRDNSTTRLTTKNSYDYLNRPISITTTPTSDTASTLDYQYNDANQRTRVSSGSYWHYEYDSLGQVKLGKKYWIDGTPIAGQQFEYAFDDIGNRTSAPRGGDQFGANLRASVYHPSSLNQYTNRSFTGGVDAIGVAHAQATVTVNGQAPYRKAEYFRSEVTVANSNPAFPSITNQAVYSGITNQTIGTIYIPPSSETSTNDADGNLALDGRYTLQWDAENQLTNLTSVTGVPSTNRNKLDFVYDFQGRRISKVVSTWNGSSYVTQSTNKFLYDGWNLLAELNHTNGIIRRYLWGLDASNTRQGASGVGGLLAVHSETSGVFFPTYDANGNVTSLVNATNGTVGLTYEYGPYGEPIRISGLSSLSFNLSPIRFSSRYADDETDLIYYGRRFYSPSIGRWLSRDPLGESGGAALYSFGPNDLINGIDPNGLSWREAWGEIKIDASATIDFAYQGFGLGQGAQIAGDYYREKAAASRSPVATFALGAGGQVLNWGGAAISPQAYVQGYNSLVDRASEIAFREMIRKALDCQKSGGFPVAQALSSLVGDLVGYNNAFESYYGIDRNSLTFLTDAQRAERAALGLFQFGATGVAVVAPLELPLDLPIEEVAMETASDSGMLTVIGSMEDVAKFKGEAGYNVLERPGGMTDAEFGRYNAEWMNQALRRGDTIMAVTDPAAHEAMLEAIEPGLSQKSNFLNIELPILQEFGATVPRRPSIPPVVPFYLKR